MADIRVCICHQQGTLTSLSIREVDQRRIYASVINKVL